MTPVLETKFDVGRRQQRRKIAFVFNEIWTPDELIYHPEFYDGKRTDFPTDRRPEKHTSFLKKFYNKGYPFAAKILWFIVIALCVAITLVQVHDRINYYLSQPVTISLQIHRNTTMEFPSITICNKAPFKRSVLNIMAKTFSANFGSNRNVTTNDLIDYYGIETLIDEASYNIPEYIVECFIQRSMSCRGEKQWTPANTALGACSTYTTANGQISTAGAFQALYLMLNADEEGNGTERGWKILIHHVNESPDILIQSHGITVYPDTRADFIVGLRQFRTVNRASQACKDDPKYSVRGCEADCLYRTLARNYSCRLPHMNIPEYPICNNSADYNAMNGKRTDFLVNSTLWNATDCGCPRQCFEDMFTTRFDIRYSPNGAKTVVKIYYEDLTYEKVEETLSYKIVSLLSDIGGNLGLFLGICVLNIFKAIEQFILLIIDKMKRVEC